MDDTSLPSLPEGFTADQSNDSVPALPTGFKLDNNSNSDVPSPPEGFQIDDEKYSTPGQQALTVAEGAGQGLIGPVATGLEKGLNAVGIPGFTDQDIMNRRKTNPGEFEGSQFVGSVGLMAMLPEVKAAQMLINGSIQGGIAAGDEYSNAMLGNKNTNSAIVAHIIGASAIGAFLPKGVGFISNSLRSMSEKKAEEMAGTKFVSRVFGLGYGLKSATPLVGEPASASAALSGIKNIENIHYPSFLDGLKDAEKYQKIGTNIIKGTIAGPIATVGSVGGAGVGSLTGHMGTQIGEAAGRGIGWGVGLGLGGALAKKVVPQVSEKIAGPILLKMAANGNFQGIAKAVDYGITNYRGYQALEKGIASIFKGGINQSTGAISDGLLGKKRENLRNYMDEIGGVHNQVEEEQKQMFQNPPGFARGGMVAPIMPETDPVAENWPDQHIGIVAAKGRVSNYLNSVKPQKNKPRLPFDSVQKDPHEERGYDKVLDMANHPLGILDHIKKGTLVPKHMTDFTVMYPELHEEFSKKMMEHIMQGQVDESKKPPYKVRQALSLFMGQNLESTLTQPNMAAAQAVFAQQNAQKQAPPSSKSNLSNLGKSAMTPEQSRTERLNKN